MDLPLYSKFSYIIINLLVVGGNSEFWLWSQNMYVCIYVYEFENSEDCQKTPTPTTTI